jgi:hypothetical protein
MIEFKVLFVVCVALGLCQWRVTFDVVFTVPKFAILKLQKNCKTMTQQQQQQQQQQQGSSYRETESNGDTLGTLEVAAMLLMPRL